MSLFVIWQRYTGHDIVHDFVIPFAGDLYYAYLTANDSIPPSSAGVTNGMLCNVRVAGDILTLNHVIDWTIADSNKTIVEFEVLAPPAVLNLTSSDTATALNPMTCVAGQICEVLCIFGGR